MPKTEYKTHHLPGYVRDWLGKPCTCTKVEKGLFEFAGPRQSIRIDADSYAWAVLALKKHVRFATQTRDGRITRHYDDRHNPDRIAIHAGRGQRKYGYDAKTAAEYARKFPLMFAEPGERYKRQGEEYVRLKDDRHCHIDMCCVRLSDGHILHTARVEYP